MLTYFLSIDGPNQIKSLDKFIKSLDGKDIVYIFFKDPQPNLLFNLRESGVDLLHVPTISVSDREQILKDYINIIGKMSLLNSENKEWWASNIASKNRMLSPLQEILNQIISSIKAIEECEKKKLNLCIIGLELSVISVLKEFANSEFMVLEVNNEFISNFKNRLMGFINIWINLAKGIFFSLANVIQTRIMFGRNKIDKNKSVFLIKSWVFAKSFSKNGVYKDPFCNDLAIHIQDKLGDDAQVVTIAQGYNERYKSYQKMRNITDRVVLPIEIFINLKDIFLAAISITYFLLFSSIKVPSKALILDCNIAPALREIVKTSGGFIQISEYLYYFLGRRLASDYKLCGCVMSYEGNHWEKMFILGIRSINPDLRIVGHHHSVIPQAAAGVFLSEDELSIAPMPDKIITSGLISSNILKRYSAFPKENIHPGCAPLYQYLYSYEDSYDRGKTVSYMVLVMLEGLLETEILVKYVINQARLLPDIKFLIRSHPSLSFESILKNIGGNLLNLPTNIKVSKCKKVSEDVKRCDVGLYWQTATSIEMLMMGRPLIWFDRGDVLSLDPLFEFDSFKWSVTPNMPLSTVLEEIQNMTDGEFFSRSSKGKEYVSQYFNKCSENSLNYFVN